MLTRLHVKGFKNLYDVDILFGPFTCIAGANGVGKSNLFDAIVFMSDLCRYSIVEAASRVRDPITKSGDIRALFYRSKEGSCQEMSFEAEFIVPGEVIDDFGRVAKPSITFLRYEVAFKYRAGGSLSADRMELARENLTHINIGSASRHLLFPHKKTGFRDSIIKGRRTGGPFISTRPGENGRAVIELHGEGKQGRPSMIPADSSPKTVVGNTNQDSHPTILAAHREMQAWRLLQLEPTALRRPDEFTADSHVEVTGAHLPATLRRLGDRAYTEVANRLSDLLPDIRRVKVDADEIRRLITLFVESRDNVPYDARSLSDGTLRFLALAVIGTDPESGGLICLEEPENGIHPVRIPAMVDLIQSLAVDPNEEVGPENPLRQVIVNTHSPLIVGEVSHDSLVVASPYIMPNDYGGSIAVKFGFLPDTWRSKAQQDAINVSMGELIVYLNGNQPYPNSQLPILLNNRKPVKQVVSAMQRELGLFDEKVRPDA